MASLECGGYVMLVVLLCPLILQGIGLYSRDWVDGSACEVFGKTSQCCINASLCAPGIGLGADTVALGFEIASCILIAFPVLYAIAEACCDPDELKSCPGLVSGLLFIGYPLAGFCSLIGCIIMRAKFAKFHLGSAFDCCLASGLYILILCILVFGYTWHKHKQSRDKTDRPTELEVESRARPENVIEFTNVQETTHVRVTPDGKLEFIRKLNVFQMFIHK
ncbi:uncharacterized protein LOC127851439 isoform X2 [Dreissena polymorpha]|uniref:Uncharacterized protein n=2 Tax=Dreissena polymorpha TaxID=45954 RepID=A0A9D4S2M1_DREPO|nr:uncharacterized protein LOC127851439 isoform X2 [Dreissena polymorpha]XP_052241188.1 uncharacterized protein LOC127851439 isoform X2 [Dreissena polymorpha]XP_052241199.1 uncharacterized protein LOC127851439 isoform X2 [Dreissena polymorpha]KAH3890264.1 hypothetical protein DPMN_014339 [Dreissena polymorpha]